MVPPSNDTADPVALVRAAVADGLAGARRYVLAVSGGVDSMVLLDAAAAVLRRRELVVATFDHGTGAAATAAVSLVANEATARGLECVVGRASAPGATEAAWREARLAFLRDVAARTRGRVATAHTRDDQVETVFMRALRGSGARGLAGLYAAGPVLRPLVSTPRATVAAYAGAAAIRFRVDPSNGDRRHLRNRVRLDLLPALRRVHPDFEDELLTLAAGAAELRARLEQVALTFPVMSPQPGTHAFPRAPLSGLPDDALRTLWPPLAARAGAVLDRRGTARLAAFTNEGAPGQSIQLAGGVEVRMDRDALVFAPLRSAHGRRARG